MRHEGSHGPLDGEPAGGITDTRAHVETEPGLRVALIVPQPDLARRRERRTGSHLEHPHTFEHQPKAAHLGVGAVQPHGLVRLDLDPHGVGLHGQVEPGRSRTVRKHPLDAESAHVQADIRGDGALAGRGEGHVAPAVPEQAPGRDPLADLDPGVGIHADEQGIEFTLARRRLESPSPRLNPSSRPPVTAPRT